jgi:APA family basic amino acid/polyamine antiporter
MSPLSRRLGLWSTALSGIGIILGAGIYVIIGAATRDAGSAVWLAFVLAALLAGMTGLAYAELASMFPFAGASPVYVREAFGRHAGFVLGWLRLAVSVITAAAVALGFGGYLADLAQLPSLGAAMAVLATSFAIIVVGVRETVAVAIVMTLLEAGGLVLILVLGADTIGSRSLLELPHGIVGLMSGAALVFFAFEGFEQIATLSEETRDPTRNIPRAILISIAASAGLYVLVAITATSALPWQRLACWPPVRAGPMAWRTEVCCPTCSASWGPAARRPGWRRCSSRSAPRGSFSRATSASPPTRPTSPSSSRSSPSTRPSSGCAGCAPKRIGPFGSRSRWVAFP